MPGFLVPGHFVKQAMTEYDVMVASMFMGFTIAFAIFSASTASRQTMQAWTRSHRATVYVAMIWGHWLANNLFGVISFLYLRDVIEASFWLWFFILFLWVFQSQLIVQIIINRISLLIMVKRRARHIKWGVFIIMTLINISVFIVWIPARLEIDEHWIAANSVWDRIEKIIFLILDAALNVYFIYLVRHGLIANGLVKYAPLFRFNVAMVFISISTDIILIGLMSLKNDLVYLQFQSVAYAVKLHIEMNMADLIKKVVRASNMNTHTATTIPCDPLTGGSKGSRAKTLPPASGHTFREDHFIANLSRKANNSYRGQNTTHIELGSTEELNEAVQNQQRTGNDTPVGIRKTTVVTQTVHRESEEHRAEERIRESEEHQVNPLTSHSNHSSDQISVSPSTRV